MPFNRLTYALLGLGGIIIMSAAGYYFFVSGPSDTPASSDKHKNWQEQFHAAHDNAPPPPIADDVPHNDAEQKLVDVVTREIEGEEARFRAVLKQRGIAVTFQNGLTATLGEHIITRHGGGEISAQRRRFYQSGTEAKDWEVVLASGNVPGLDPSKLREKAADTDVATSVSITRYNDDCEGTGDMLRLALAARKGITTPAIERDLPTAMTKLHDFCTGRSGEPYFLSDGSLVQMRGGTYYDKPSIRLSVSQREKLSALIGK